MARELVTSAGRRAVGCGGDAGDGERDKQIAAFRQALAVTGMVVTTATTNLFGHPMFKEGALTANDRAVRRFALAKVMRNIDLAPELGASVECWGGREGAESGVPGRAAQILFVPPLMRHWCWDRDSEPRDSRELGGAPEPIPEPARSVLTRRSATPGR